MDGEGLASWSHGMRRAGGVMSGPIGKNPFWGTRREVGAGERKRE
jgi:hypothetical protein